MEIVFVRHGEADKSTHLTSKGVKQAKRLAKRLKRERFDELYCSELNRSKETSRIVSKKIKISPTIEKGLNEFETSTLKTRNTKWTNEEKEHHKSLVSFLERILNDLHKNKRIIIIAHGITNRFILSYFMKIDPGKLISFMQKETCINKVSWNDKFRNWRLISWNDFSHLKKKP